MITPLPHFVWQTLRYMARAEATGKDAYGRELRMTPTRRTKDGTFLDELVDQGLIEAVSEPVPFPPGASRSEKKESPQFRTRYRLTELGRHAAEYGEYDMPFTPANLPLIGTFAELVDALAAKNSNWSHSTKPRKRKK
jgi:hypothetical protein